MIGPEIKELIQMFAKLPGLGPRSGRRAALHLIKHKENLMKPMLRSLATAADKIVTCTQCGNLDTKSPCGVCTDPRRDTSIICVIEDIADLWALERTASFKGQYHIIGGTLSALDGIGPEDLRISKLIQRAQNPEVQEIILALSATVDGQTTAHYIADALSHANVQITALANGVPMGGELDYLDDGTISTALNARRILTKAS